MSIRPRSTLITSLIAAAGIAAGAPTALAAAPCTVAYNGDTIPEPELARRVERLQTVLAADDPRILHDELFAAIRTPVHA